MPFLPSLRHPLPGARPLGRVDAGSTLTVTLLLRRAGGRAPLGEGPVSRLRTLTRAEFASRWAAAEEDRQRVRSFAEAKGLTPVPAEAGPRTERMRGPAGAMERAFGCRLDRYVHPGGSYRGRTGALELPADLAAVTIGVFGLDDRPQCRPHFRRRRVDRAGDVSYAPAAVGAAYGFPPSTDGTGQTIGLLELGGGFNPSDLQRFFEGTGRPPPSIAVVPVDEATNSPTGSPDGPDGEVALDLELAGALAPGARLAVYFAPNTDQGFLDGVSAAIHDTKNSPSALSISWGGPEPSWTAQALTGLDSVFEDGTSLGVTITASAVDNGALDSRSAGPLEVDFPASSPYVLGCGGTRLALAGSTVRSEVVWNDLSLGEGATGGGVSRQFPPPAYQASVAVPPNPAGAPGRGVPDVAGNADPATGYAVIVDGAPSVIGGTSAVAPLWAALVVRLNQALGRPIGFAQPALYGPEPLAGFRDITSGGNGGYSAGPGWDPCTGLGSPVGEALLQRLRRGSP
jgi:kumamolisin